MPADDARRKEFELLFAANHGPVRAYVLRRAPVVVDDVVAETFLAAWRRLDTIGEDPLPWLLAVARRALANQLRAERRREALTRRLRREPVGAYTWEPPDSMSPALADAMASLSWREREALLLVAWEGLDPARAAVAAGCTAAAFRVRLHRARRRVAAALQHDDEHGTSTAIVKEIR